MLYSKCKTALINTTKYMDFAVENMLESLSSVQ